ncbi:SDR family oxidoreductase [Aspergillus saccharolyticus JOP 1030-1]|uniref:Flavonol reductase n=1 Tax=Aspergillus saccharolyticus JOP 1030-1 TaxID=1450539 RepID=A0A318ZER5_9EURO|nr:flavonol reductase [Aspergillus saccharolyticus JOP 1030-1]PYH46051.1 flavonol reductase [Aspergillus saccharolyticus JOP 1030-1]
MLILLTGANGFIAAHCIFALVHAGHTVRGTVRTPQKATATRAALQAAGLPQHQLDHNLEIVIVPDLTNPTHFTPAIMAGCEAVLHLASAFTYEAQPGQFEEKLLRPAVQGTTVLCEAAHQTKTVRRVVIVSSFAAVYDAAKGPQPGKVYTDADWSPLGFEEGRDTRDVAVAYRASKVLAEKAAWEFVAIHSADFQLVTLCPGMVFGRMIHPIESLDELNASNRIVWGVVKGGTEIPPTKAPVWVDVEDLADACLRALTLDSPCLATHQRFLVTQGAYDTQEIADIVRELVPQSRSRIAIGTPGKRIRDSHYGCDARKIQQVLGVRFRGLRESIIPLVEQLYAMEKDC